MKDTDSWLQVINALTPLFAVIVVGVTSWVPSFLTNRANRKLAAYNRKKEELASFTKSCGKYFGITAILSSAMNDESRYANKNVQVLTECKWEILSYLGAEKSNEICDKMERIESLAMDLWQKVILCTLFSKENNEKMIQEEMSKIEDIKRNIYYINNELQLFLIKHKQALSNELERR